MEMSGQSPWGVALGSSGSLRVQGQPVFSETGNSQSGTALSLSTVVPLFVVGKLGLRDKVLSKKATVQTARHTVEDGQICRLQLPTPALAFSNLLTAP